MRFLSRAVLMLAARLLLTEAIASTACELPIHFREGLIWLEVNVRQSQEALHFLVDSGASASVVNLSTAKRLGLPLGPKVKVTAVATKLTGYWPTKLSAKADQLELPDQFLALDLSRLSGACNRSVDGLLGADFFRERVIQIDYAAQKIRVLMASPSAPGANVVPLRIRSCSFCVGISVNGSTSQWVRVDTGCASALQWVTSNGSAERSSTKVAVGFAELSIPQAITSVRIGNDCLDAVPTGFHRKPIFPGESGLLGNGLLAQFSLVTIDGKSGHLILGRPADAK